MYFLSDRFEISSHIPQSSRTKDVLTSFTYVTYLCVKNVRRSFSNDFCCILRWNGSTTRVPSFQCRNDFKFWLRRKPISLTTCFKHERFLYIATKVLKVTTKWFFSIETLKIQLIMLCLLLHSHESPTRKHNISDSC